MARKTRQRISYVLPLANATPGHRLGVNGITLDRESAILYTAGRDGQIYAWDTDRNATRPPQSPPPSGVSRPAARYRQHVQAHSHWINDIVLVYDNSALVSASSDNSVKLWRPHAEDVAAPRTIGLHNDYVKTLASPGRHARWVASGGLDHKIKLWDLERGVEKLEIQNSDEEFPDRGSVYALCANDYLLASGGPESVVKIWDARSGKRVTKFVGHTDNIRDVLISQDSDTVMTASSDQTVKVWSMTAGRCMYTLTMHNDSVWSLYSDHPQLSVFYSGDRAGFVAKTDTRGVSDADDGLSIALCQEQQGVNKIVTSGSTLWTATASASINRWADVDMSAGLQIPESMSNYRWNDNSRLRTSISSKPDPQQPHTNSTRKKIPLNCILRISNAARWPPLQLRTRPDRSASQQTDGGRKNSTAVFETAIGAFEPLRVTPDGTIEGQNGLIRHILLNDRRRVLTLDTTGEVMMWDLLQCMPTQTFGKRPIEDVVPEVNTIGAMAQWCTVDTRTGLLTCVLEENHCFDAEMYADELKEASYMAFREDQRINLGKWVLRYLFATLLDEEIRRDEIYRSTLEHKRSGRATMKNSNRPTSIPLPQNQFSGWSESQTATPRPLKGGHLSLKTPGFAIGLATPGGPLKSSPVNARPSPMMSPGGSNLGSANPYRQSIEKSADYFSAKPADTTQSPVQAAPGGPMSPKIPATPGESAIDLGPLSPSLGDKGGGFKKFRLSFAGKKLTKAQTADLATKAMVPNVREDGFESESPKQEDLIFDDSFYGTIQRIHNEYQNPEHELLGVLETLVLPGLPNELPVLKPPLNTTVIIQEESSDSAGIQDVYEGRIGDLGRYADKIEKVAPVWLGDALLRNRIPIKDVVKVSFTLEPYNKKELPHVTGNDGTERLNANRMLRARKILSYVAERLEPHKEPLSESSFTQQQQESPRDQMRPEDYLELYCHDELVPMKMTLATIRTHLWKGGGDVALFYRANGKRRISLPPPPPHNSTPLQAGGGGVASGLGR